MRMDCTLSLLLMGDRICKSARICISRTVCRMNKEELPATHPPRSNFHNHSSSTSPAKHAASQHIIAHASMQQQSPPMQARASVTYRAQRKADGAQMARRRRCCSILRVVVSARCAELAVSSFHIILALWLPGPLRKQCILLPSER